MSDEESGIVEEEIKNFQENIVTKVLQDSMNENENDRYEFFRSSKIADMKIKKIVQQNLGNVSLSELVTVIIRTATKVYIGELVEESKVIQEEKGEKGPITPLQLSEAKRRLQMQNKDLSQLEFTNIFN